MEENKAIPVLDNMPDDVKAIVEYLNKNNISFDDYSGNTDDDDDDIELDQSFYDGGAIETDNSDIDESSDSDDIDIDENDADAADLSDLDSMF